VTWQFFIVRRPPSMNDRLHNSGPTRFAYAKVRDLWIYEFRAARLAHRIPQATGPRRLVARRQYSGREQERDFVNLVGGFKPIVDAMVREGLLVDDKPALLADEYAQERVEKTQPSGVLFVLSDIEIQAIG
jgi:hypothetical protein